MLNFPSAVAENQPTNKYRMNQEFANFAARLRESFTAGFHDKDFNALALELFALQFKHNSAYRKICEARGLTPKVVEHWTRILFVPTSAFKELELTSLVPDERTSVFHSSGTTEQKPSRHFHCAESLEIYETSLWAWFNQNVFGNSKLKIQNSKLICLTPPPKLAPHSSLVHMFEIVRQKIGASESVFAGKAAKDGTWTLDFDAALAALDSSLITHRPSLLLGTAFSFVHLLDFLTESNLRFQLPANSRVMETGGYKNRSRALPKAELHSLIATCLGIPRENILCEYGMSELSSQAYSVTSDEWQVASPNEATHHFQFPPWARAQIISPETGREVREGETGLIRIFDLANVFSVAAVQTEDLGIRRSHGFELAGKAQLAEPRGCSLMSA